MATTRFLQADIKSRVPEQLTYDMVLKSHSVVTQRNTRIYQPTTGAVFTPAGTNIIELPLSSSNYFDLQTFALLFNAAINLNAADANSVVAFENGYSWIQKAELYMNGTLVSSIQNVPQLVGTIVAGSCSQDYYDSELSKQGFFLDSSFGRAATAIGGNNANIRVLDPDRKAAWISAQQTSATGMNLKIDLAPVFGLFGQSIRFFPARNLSNMTMRLYLLPPAQALTTFFGLNPAGGAPGTTAAAINAATTYTLSNVRAYIDEVVCNPVFTAEMDSFIASSQMSEGGGLILPFNDYTVQPIALPGGVEADLLLAKSCKYLKTVYASIHCQADLNSSASIKSERQKFVNITGAQLNLGGTLFPQDRPRDRATLQYETCKAFNVHMDTLGSNLLNARSAVGFSVVATTPNNVADTAAMTAATDVTTICPDITNGFVNHSVIGINTEQIIVGNSSDGVLNGIPANSGAGLIIRLAFSANPNAAAVHTLIAYIHFLKIVRLRFNEVNVIE